MAVSMNMMHLFDDMTDSPMTKSSPNLWCESEIETLLTPFSKGFSSTKNDSSLLMDEDSGLGMDTDAMEEISSDDDDEITSLETGKPDMNGSLTEGFSIFRRPVNRRTKEHQVKRSLFAGKRPADSQDNDVSPLMKKLRNNDTDLRKFVLTNSTDCAETEVHSIIRAVDRLTTKDELVADGTRDYSLPTIPGKHTDLKCVSDDTMARLLAGEFGGLIANTKIIDCRYPYEYKGGHIKGAVNMYTKDEIDQLLNLTGEDKPRVLIFHCEFSSERGPKMYRFLRNQDRTKNKDNYPQLNFPEIYLLDGGYQKFYASYRTLCDPISYKPMLHQDHSEDLRHFRIKSKSWAGNQKQSHRSRLTTGRSLSFKF